MPIVAGGSYGHPSGRFRLTAGARAISVGGAAGLAAEWRGRLGYLRHGAGVQRLADTFGDLFVRPSASGSGCIRCDVLAALHSLAPAPEWIDLIDCCEW